LSPFSLVHYDIWGPFHILPLPLLNIVTFIDDYSRCTWIWLMKNQPKVFSIFQTFFKEIKTQIGISTSMYVFRSDNACEYLSNQL